MREMFNESQLIPKLEKSEKPIYRRMEYFLPLRGQFQTKVFHCADVEAKDAGEGAFKLKVRWLITKDIGAPNFAMRLFEMKPGGYSPLHSHDWEHEVFILEGEGAAIGGSEQKGFKPGDAVFIPSNEKHQFRNTGKKLVKFLCLVPHHE